MTNPKKPKNDPSPFNISQMDVEEFNRQERESSRKEFAKLKEIAEDIDDLYLRYEFWNNAQKEYKMKIWDAELPIYASGVVSLKSGGLKLWLDYLIECEKDTISDLIKTIPTDSTSNAAIPTADAFKMALLYELGVINFLKERLRDSSASPLSFIISKFTGISPGSAKLYLTRLHHNARTEGNHAAAKELIIQKYKKAMKPLPDIEFDKDVE